MNFIPKRDELNAEVDLVVHVCNAQQCHRHLLRQTDIGVVLSLSHTARISSSVKP